MGIWNWFKFKFLTTRYLIQINYKSRNSVKLWFVYFEVTKGLYDLYIWKEYNHKILKLNTDEIESIFVLKTKHRPFTFKPKS